MGLGLVWASNRCGGRWNCGGWWLATSLDSDQANSLAASVAGMDQAISDGINVLLLSFGGCFSFFLFQLLVVMRLWVYDLVVILESCFSFSFSGCWW